MIVTKIFIGVVLFLLTTVSTLAVMTFKKNNMPTPITQQQKTEEIKKKVIGWIPYWDQQNAAESFYRNPQSFDYISVFWYRLDTSGNIKTYQSAVEDERILTTARDNNVKVLAIIANLPDGALENGSWDPNRVNRVISSKAAREQHIAAILNLVREKNFDGIDIDYEALRENQRENFSLFVEELSDALHKEGKILGVAIHPKTGENIPEEANGSQAQDLEKIAKAADQLYFMTYLENGTFSEAGPPGSIPWMRRVMEYAVNTVGIPREKAYLGIGLMGVEWNKNEDGSTSGNREDVTFNEIQEIVNQNDITIQWDSDSQTPFFESPGKNGSSVIWFENKESVAKRIDLANELGIGGIALWRLGGEDPQILPQLKNK